MVAACNSGLCLAQDRASRRSGDIIFADFVPASARIFVSTRSLGQIDAAIRRAHGVQMVSLLSEPTARRGDDSDVRSIVSRLLGVSGSDGLADLANSAVGMVASSWTKLPSAVWFVRPPRKGALDTWFPPDTRIPIGPAGEAFLFRTHAGLTVCARSDVVAIGRQWHPASLLMETAKLMAGRKDAPLSLSKEFRALTAYLPTGYVGLVYVQDSDGDSVQTTGNAFGWPRIEHAVFGLYEGKGRLDIAVRASLAGPHSNRTLAQTAVDRVVQLPHTTLLAFASPLGIEHAFRAGGADGTFGWLGRLTVFLGELDREAETPETADGPLGPGLIIAWGQDFRERQSAPQIAVLLECSAAASTLVRVNRIAERLARLVIPLDDEEADAEPRLLQRRYLGTTIYSLSLQGIGANDTHPLLGAMENVEPAWTISDGWLIVAMSPEHIERLLDAQYAVAPTLAAVADVASLRRRAIRRSALAVLQPDLATEVLRGWLDDYEAGALSLLDPSYWGGSTPVGRSGVVIEIEEGPVPGCVTVLDVRATEDRETALRRGDRILGVDGVLLPLSFAASELRTRLKDRAARGSTLRVRRGETALDLPLRAGENVTLSTGLRAPPIEATRELIALGEALQFASFEVHATDATHYSARLSLRLAPVSTRTSSNGK